MRRSMWLPLTAWILVATVGGVDAQSPSPPTASGAIAGPRSMDSESRVAVDLPADWTIEASFGETYAISPDDSAHCRPASTQIDKPVDDPDALLDELAAIYPVFFDDGPLPIVDTTELVLPAGRSIRYVSDFALQPDRIPQDERRYATMYLLTDGHSLVFFGCWSDYRPADDWLSIAETIEFLPVEE